MAIFRIIGVSGFALIYCLAVALDTWAPLEVVQPAGSLHEKSSVFTQVVSELPEPNAPSQRTNFSTAVKILHAPLDTPVWFGAALCAISGHWQAIYTQYAGFSYNFSISQRKADLLFPFHYFW